MEQIKCPKCGEVFQIDEAGYAAIVKQVRDREFEKELRAREETAVRLAESEKEREITALRAKLGEQEKLGAAERDAAVQRTVAEKEKQISALEEKDSLAGFLDDANTDETGIQVYIGEESPVESIKDCSVVTATYDLGDGLQGTIGIIGPKRMDYERVMDNLKTVRATLNDVFKKNPGIADEKGRDE